MDTIHIEGEIVINRPVEIVFDFVANECNEPRYNPRILRADKISDGPIGLGTQFRAETAGMGKPVEIIIEITAYDRPRQLTSSIRMSIMDINGTLTFDLASNGTRMQWSWDIKPHGVFKLMKPMLGIIGKRQEQHNWKCLKHYLEAQEAPPGQ